MVFGHHIDRIKQWGTVNTYTYKYRMIYHRRVVSEIQINIDNSLSQVSFYNPRNVLSVMWNEYTKVCGDTCRICFPNMPSNSLLI